MVAKKTVKRKPRRAEKAPNECKFARCTEEERAACTFCPSAIGRNLCRLAAKEWSAETSPRVRHLTGAEKDYTQTPNSVSRWSLGPKYDGVWRTFNYLVSWTRDGTDLVHQRTARQFAAGRDLDENQFYKHITILEALGFLKKLPRHEVTGKSARGDEYSYLLRRPEWATQVADLLDQLAALPTDKARRAKADGLRRVLKTKQGEVIRDLEAKLTKRKSLRLSKK